MVSPTAELAVGGGLKKSSTTTPVQVQELVTKARAAQAKFDSGASGAADRLLAVAETCPLDGLQRVRVGRLRAEREGVDLAVSGDLLPRRIEG